ncbi:VOC family protein [Microbacterium sp. ASV49]|uniref:Glyoxalase n=1 Tax=Microbacterium candidum TaxID=3041922 RepID=A0ABT7MYE5_9MICO|nr:VOC family protein [Microbacterium sp. ASV49]MDL9979475.1 glyoxalase [Microbacterium sp. ASV49]
MSTDVYVNLPSDDLDRAKEFYLALGTTFRPELSDDNGICIAWDDNIFLMLIKREFFATFTDKPIADPNVTLQTSVAFSRPSREDVDAVVAAGVAAGGAEPRPAQDYGFMYSRDLDDPDGNSLGFLYAVPAEAATDRAEALA